jgi:hypothetical protein
LTFLWVEQVDDALANALTPIKEAPEAVAA